MSEAEKLAEAIADAYQWLRDETGDVELSPDCVERLVHAARHYLEALEAITKSEGR